MGLVKNGQLSTLHEFLSTTSVDYFYIGLDHFAIAPVCQILTERTERASASKYRFQNIDGVRERSSASKNRVQNIDGVRKRTSHVAGNAQHSVLRSANRQF